jgi:hypothetical protein
MYIKSSSGKMAQLRVGIDGQVSWKDLETNITCNVTMNEDETELIIGDGCQLNWTNTSVIKGGSEDEPEAIYGPNGELYYPYEEISESTEVNTSQ